MRGSSAGFCGGRKTGEPGEKPSTCDAGSGNRTQDTLVEGERSHHCAITVTKLKSKFLLIA